MISENAAHLLSQCSISPWKRQGSIGSAHQDWIARFLGPRSAVLAIFILTMSNMARAEEPSGTSSLDVHALAGVNERLTRAGIASCANCHNAPNPINQRSGVTQFVRLSEAAQWLEKDKHYAAYDLVRIDLEAPEFDRPEHVSNKRSRDMVAKLGWKQGDGNFERKCLTCHAGLESDADLSNAELRENLQYGVQCESCHGSGEKYLQPTEHQQPVWRTKSVEEKAALGMNDLSNAVVRAEVCLSCHLGHLPSGRFVTHDMYAAGHPPLPPFDLQTFVDAMPPHWGTIQEKPYPNEFVNDKSSFKYQREYLLTHFAIDASKTDSEIREAVQKSFERSKQSMLGAMVTQDTSLQLLRDAADQPAVWGDYALFDCMGCHQTLFKDRSRYRATGRVPGRPFPPTWLTVSDTLTGELLPTDPIRAKVDDAFNRVPFGDRDRFKAESASLTKFLEERKKLAYEWSKQVVDAADAKEWVALLIEEQSPKLGDYWVAKQTAWMVQVAVGELVDKKQLDASAVAEDLGALDRILLLKLQIPQRESVLKEQMSTLETARSFDANQVRKHLESIRSALL